MHSRILMIVGLTLAGSACSPTRDEAPPVPKSAEELAAEREATALRSRFLEGELLPTGARVTPESAPGALFQPLNPDLPGFPEQLVDHAVTTALSPDGKTLLILTSGYNRLNGPTGARVAEASTEHVFVYDVSTPTPQKRQVVRVPNTFVGMAWNPSGREFYVTGGNDDVLRIYGQDAAGSYAEVGTVALGHAQGEGLRVAPVAAGVAVNRSGTRAVVANYYNDSVSIVDLASRTKVGEQDLRPGKIDPAQRGVAGGSYPYWVAFRGDDTAYVTSQRDHEVVVLRLTGDAASVTGRIKVGGQPTHALLDRAGARLFVANANSDTVSVIDTETAMVREHIVTSAPKALFSEAGKLRGANPNFLALSPDEQTLYVTNGGTNSLALIALEPGKSRVHGLVPTGWYPNAVSVSADGAHLYVVNAKESAGPNPGACRANTSTDSTANAGCNAQNQYIWQLEKAGFLTLPVPSGEELTRQTWQTAINNNFPAVQSYARSEAQMRELREHIKHVIYIIKENRTYDQVLGDLEIGNGEPSLAIFPEPISPNHHKLAREFVTLDNFLDSGETSGVGWNWTLAARTTDMIEKTQPVNYAGRGLSYDWEGQNRGINVGLRTLEERVLANVQSPNDPDVLPGTRDVASHDVPEDGEDEEEEVADYLWEAALKKGLTVRNYGCFGDGERYSASHPQFIPLDPAPSATGTVQFIPAKQSLKDVSAPYFRGYDMKYPDVYRYREWEKEFDEYAKAGELPNLQLVRLPHDHFGDFASAIDGVNTPDTQMADNDYAVGLLVEKIANSRFRDDTVVFVIEDDAQNGPDHVDGHRSVLFVAGPYVKKGALVSRSYNTVNAVRTIEDLLGLDPMGLTDGLAEPMADLFDMRPEAREWSYRAALPEVLRTTRLPLPGAAQPNDELSGAQASLVALPRESAEYWARAMRGQNFAREDALDTDRFNRELWHGLKGSSAAYPVRVSR